MNKQLNIKEKYCIQKKLCFKIKDNTVIYYSNVDSISDQDIENMMIESESCYQPESYY
jgi:hypothetical protein